MQTDTKPIKFLKLKKGILKFTTIIFITFFITLISKGLKAQKEFDDRRGTQHWIKFSDAPNSLYHYIAGQAYDYLDERSDKIAEINSLSGWKQRQEWIKNTLEESVGTFPAKTLLNARITKSYNKDGFRLENIIYESQPGYDVTAGLFIPDGIKKGNKAPVIIYCSGHSDNAYRAKIYLHTILNLVQKGFIVFAFDPIGQGERLQYLEPKTSKSRFKWPSYEHSYAGAQPFITGNTVARNFIWDGIRAVDYLLTRKEIDPNEIGITGRSGGGTQSAFIAAFDSRIKAVGAGNYFTNFTRLFQSMGPQDAEQNFFNGIKRGLDMADLIEVRAPKPMLMITTSRDMFPIQGAIETCKEVSGIYEAYNKPENFQMVMDDAPHASTKKNRESMYAFFQRVLNNPGDSTDHETEQLSKEELQVTKTGQVATSLNSESVYSLNYKDAEKKMQDLQAKRKDLPAYFSEIIASAKKLSGYEEPREADKQIFAGRVQRDGYVIEKYLVKGEGDYMIPYILFKPETASGKAVIYLDPEGKSAEAEPGGQLEWFARNGFTVLAPDMIGTGELGPGIFKGDSYIDSVSYNLWFASMLVGRSIVGIQAGDLVKLANLLKKEKNIKEIYGVAKREMSPLLLHVAAFDKDIKKIALLEPYSSYCSIVMNPRYDADFLHSTVPGAIGKYDLPDLAASLAPGKLLMVGVTDGNGDHTNTEDINKDISVIRAAYQNKKATDKLQIESVATKEELSKSLKRWLEN